MDAVSNRTINDTKILNYFAGKAKENIDINTNLYRITDLYTNYIKEIKIILSDKEKIKDHLKILNNNLRNNIEKIKAENIKLKNKYDIYYNKCTDELEMGRPILNQISSDLFTLEYSLSQKDVLIQKLKRNLKKSKYYCLFREPKRENFLETKEANSSIKKVAEESQLDLITFAKKYNSIKEKSKKKKKKIISLKEKIEQLNELIYSIKTYIKNEKQINPNIKSVNKALSTTPSINSGSSTQKVLKISENQNFVEKSEKFEIFENSKKFEEDSYINNNCFNNNQEIKNKNSKNVINAILSTKIPDSFGQFKSMSLYPMQVEELQNKEKKYNDNNKIKNINNNYDINVNKALSAENRKIKKIKNPKKNKNKIIQSFLNLEDLFEISDTENNDENDVLIDIMLHSDDETILENRIIPNKTLSKSYKDNIDKEIPKISLELIEYNKLKVVPEIDLYSLKRRNYKGDNLDINIKIVKKKIKKLQAKEELNSKKVNAMKKYIDELKNKYLLYKKIRTKSSAFNCEVKYVSNNEIIDLKNSENEDESYGSDYLNEDDEISENIN